VTVGYAEAGPGTSGSDFKTAWSLAATYIADLAQGAAPGCWCTRASFAIDVQPVRKRIDSTDMLVAVAGDGVEQQAGCVVAKLLLARDEIVELTGAPLFAAGQRVQRGHHGLDVDGLALRVRATAQHLRDGFAGKRVKCATHQSRDQHDSCGDCLPQLECRRQRSLRHLRAVELHDEHRLRVIEVLCHRLHWRRAHEHDRRRGALDDRFGDAAVDPAIGSDTAVGGHHHQIGMLKANLFDGPARGCPTERDAGLGTESPCDESVAECSEVILGLGYCALPISCRITERQTDTRLAHQRQRRTGASCQGLRRGQRRLAKCQPSSGTSTFLSTAHPPLSILTLTTARCAAGGLWYMRRNQQKRLPDVVVANESPSMPAALRRLSGHYRSRRRQENRQSCSKRKWTPQPVAADRRNAAAVQSNGTGSGPSGSNS